MKGMTLEFATGRVFEFEEKRDVAVNRLMIDNYLRSLQRGLEKNVSEYYKSKNLDNLTGPEVLKSITRDLKEEMSAIQFKQFEIKGYDKMLERLLKVPDQSVINEGHATPGDQVQSRLTKIHEALQAQREKNAEMEDDIDLRIRAEKIRLLQK